MKKIIALCMIFTFIISCKCQKNQESEKNNFITLYSSDYGGRETESYLVINSQESLNNLFKELYIEDFKSVDFAKNNVVALFLGEKNTGGHGIEIESLRTENDTTFIKVKKIKPEPGSMVTQAFTNPYYLAVIPKTKQVIFE